MTVATISASSLAHGIDTAAKTVEQKLVAWRRDIHQHPELATASSAPASWWPSISGNWAWTMCKKA